MSMDVQSGIPADEQVEVRRRALPAVAAYATEGASRTSWIATSCRDDGFLGCRPVEDGRLAGLFFDDLQFAGGDTRRSRGAATSPTT